MVFSYVESSSDELAPVKILSRHSRFMTDVPKLIMDEQVTI